MRIIDLKINNHVVLFDGECNLCSGVVKFLIRHDKKGIFKFASLQSDAGKSLTKYLKIDTNNIDSVIYIKQKTAYIESDAAFEILKDMGGWWKTLLIFQIFPLYFRNLSYRLIAKNRYKVFGKRTSCFLPSPKLKSKFL